jgi:hypothetical protein
MASNISLLLKASVNTFAISIRAVFSEDSRCKLKALNATIMVMNESINVKTSLGSIPAKIEWVTGLSKITVDGIDAGSSLRGACGI